MLLCAGPRQFLSQEEFPAPLPPTCISLGPTGDKPWYLHRGKFSTIYIQPSAWGNQRGELPLCIKQISGAVAGDSSLQDRGVAHYLLSLLFSLVSLPFSFYFCVPNQKYQKSAATMGFKENTKLCDFTSHNNSDFIYTPIAPPATSAPSYEIKPALLNLVMKDQFSSAGEDAPCS